MERKQFIKSLMVGIISTPILWEACKKDSLDVVSSESVTDSGSGTSSSTCAAAPSETEGPFPTKTPSSYVRSDITDGRSGYKLIAKIAIANSNNDCTPITGAMVDIWHCDAEGNYSEYGGSGMQSSNYQSVHFLRGRQITDENGLVTFTSIFPGWYNGRATHIHVHVYNAAGNSLKVTQIAFPEGSGTAVAIVNGYKKGMSGYTYNAKDNVFSDDKTNSEVATVTGSIADGFNLTMKINVPA